MYPTLVRFQLHGVERALHSYAVCLLAGLALGLAVTVARARRFGVDRFDAFALGMLGVVGGLAGAALLYDVVHLRELVADPSLWWTPGFVFYGGLGGGCLAAALYARRYRVSLAGAADAAAPGLALGHAVGRVGCLLAGCCYGRVVDPRSPLAVTVAGAARQPVQLYEAAALLVLAVVTARLRLRRPGALFALYLGAYALVRLATERLRGDDGERGFVVAGLLSTSQAIAAALLLVTVATTLSNAFRARHKGAA